MNRNTAIESSQEEVMDYLLGKPEGITFMLPNTRANASRRCLLPWGYDYYLGDDSSFPGRRLLLEGV